MKYLVLGAKGTLGQELVRHIHSQAHAECFAFSHSELAIEDYSKITDCLKTLKPDVVINACAYNAVDQAEDEPAKAFLINSEAVLHLARLTQQAGMRMVHYSTDYVFDGNASSPYTEASLVNPLSVYGKSKWLGEQAVLAAHPQSYCLRTAVVFGQSGNNFFTRLCESTKSKTQIDMVTDLVGCPMPAASLAQITLALLAKAAPYGLYHAVGSAACTRYEFAQEIVRVLNLPVTLNPTKMDPTKSKANRPLRVVMQNTKLKELGIVPLTWQEGIKEIYKNAKS